jgi:dipeptidyl aminopeptidase/acylaminoacyl peptidase
MRTSIAALCFAVASLSWATPLCPQTDAPRRPHIEHQFGSEAATGAGISSTDAPRRLAIEDQFAIKRVAGAQISPDGEWVAYTLTTTDLEKERSTTQIWMVSTRGGDPVPLTMSGESASSPRWSPDGKYLSFTASRGENGRSQVWLLDRRGGEAQQLTDVEQGVGSYEWSPDGSRLVLTIRDPEESAAAGEGGAGSSARSRAREPWVIDRLQIKRDGTGYLTDTRKTHLYVFDVASKKLTQITSGRWDEGSPAWSPDGTRIAFVSNRTEDPDANSNSDVWVVAADNTDKGGTLVRITDYEGADGSPAWSSDGKWIAFTTGINDPRYAAFETSHLAVAPSDGRGPRRILTEALDRNVGSPRFTADGRGILVSVSDEGEGHLARVDVQTGAVTRLIDGEIMASGYSVSDGGTLATVVSSHHMPGEVFVRDGEGLRRLTRVNDSLMASLELAEVRNIHYPSADGTIIEGWVYFPPGFQEGTRYPAMLRIHGGPNGMYGVGFHFEAQLFAANGYLAILTNPRGSSGYGREFGFALWQKWGIPDFDDVMAGVDYAIAQGWADGDRLGVGGWSYGGILTNYVITKTDRFKSADSGASMGLLVANFGHDHYQLGNEREWGLPWESRDLWEKLSPFNDIHRVTTPTIFLCGESDWNVPVLNSEQLYQALRRRGIETRLVVYPGQPHGLRIPSYSVHRYREYMDWHGRYVNLDNSPSG